ncbi:MAG TPA: hypothetical protein VEA63_06435 [Opitutus sp.]|nr:hypothetical protein [Opitutus sp.]
MKVSQSILDTALSQPILDTALSQPILATAPYADEVADAVAAIKSSPRLGHLHAIIRRELANAKDGVHANPARWSAAVEMWERLAELFGVRT